MENRLYRSRTNRMIGGVCGGLGEYFGIDPTIVRIVFVLLALADGLGILAYILLWVLMPKQERIGAPPRRVIEENIQEVAQESQRMGEEIGALFKGGGPTTPEVEEVEPPRASRRPERALLAGGLLILLGFVFLLNNLNWFWWLDFDILWPLILIAIGVAIVIDRMWR